MPAQSDLESDIQRMGIDLSARAWDEIQRRVSNVHVPRGGKIQNQARVADAWMFLASGIAASEQTLDDGTITIARFFEPGHMCANFTSVWAQDIASDDLVANTNVSGVAIPDDFFRREYLQGGLFGEYLRLKMIEAHLFAKDLICAKTSGRTEERYRFLLQQHASVVGTVQQKEIARFLGITPQGLSRFRRPRKPASS